MSSFESDAATSVLGTSPPAHSPHCARRRTSVSLFLKDNIQDNIPDAENYIKSSNITVAGGVLVLYLVVAVVLLFVLFIVVQLAIVQLVSILLCEIVCSRLQQLHYCMVLVLDRSVQHCPSNFSL